MAIHQYLTCVGPDDEELCSEIRFSRPNSLADRVRYHSVASNDPSTRVEVPVDVLARLQAALEAVHVLRPGKPVLSGEPYDEPDPFMGAAVRPYWVIDPTRSEYEQELYSKVQPYADYVGTEMDDLDVYFFDKADSDRLKLIKMTELVASGKGRVLLYQA